MSAAVLVGAGAACGDNDAETPVSAARTEPVSDDRFRADFTRLYEQGREEIGRDYACAVLRERPGGYHARVAAVSDTGLDAARTYVARLAIAGRTDFVKVAPRYRHDEFARIVRRLATTNPQAASPRDGGTGGYGLQSPVNGRVCPKVEITIEPRSSVNAAQEQWAREAQQRYGRDRVAIRRGRSRED